MKTKIKKIFFLLSLGLTMVPVPTAFAAQSIFPGFNPDRIVEDFVFSNTKSFNGPDAIQQFLAEKRSVLANTDKSFLVSLREPADSTVKENLEDIRPNLSRNRTAAELIWDAAQSSGLNPQVILVTLNKEQSLITGQQNSGPEKLQRALDFAMGFGCPDNQPCGEIYRGFYAQLFGGYDAENNRYLGAAKSLMRSFSTPGGRGPAVNGSVAKIGDTITLDNTIGDYDGVMPQQTVRIGNAATAALYRYTPHVFNGNYNFWRFFNTWFKLTDGTLIRQKSKSAKVYMLQGGLRFEILPFVAEARNLNMKDAIVVSKSELNGYPLADEPLGLPDNTLVKQDDKLYVFINNQKRPVLAVIAQLRGLSPQTALVMNQSEAKLFKEGEPLAPPDGVLLKGQTDPAIYLSLDGGLRLFTKFTFSQKSAGTTIETISDEDLKSLPKSGYVSPTDGTLIKITGSSTVYVFDGGQKRPITGAAFKARGYKFNQVIELPLAEADLYPTGSVIDQTAQVAPTTGGSQAFNPAIKEGALIKGKGSPLIYVVEGAQKRALSYEVFVARGLKFTNVIELPLADVNAYPVGPDATATPKTVTDTTVVTPPSKLPPNMTFFANSKTGEFYVFMNGVKRIIFGFVAKQKQMTPDVKYDDAYVKALPSGSPVAPRDGTVMKGDKSSTVYLVEKALLRPMTQAAFQARRLTAKQIQVQPQAEVDAYAKGAVLTK